MKQLLRKPFLLAFILSLPLWVIFNNYVVALCVALLVAFLLSMLDSMVAIQRQQRQQHRSTLSSQPDNPTDSSPCDRR